MKCAKSLNQRKPRGFALISIIILGVFAIAMMLALFPLILNIIRIESTGRSMNELRNAAEIGIDYGIKQLNDYAIKQPAEPCPIDLVTSTVPDSYLGGFKDGTVKVRIRQLSASDWGNLRNYSTIYSPFLDKQMGPSAGNISTRAYSSPVKTVLQTDYWRIIESTAKRGAFSRSVRVFLEPRFDIPPGESSLLAGGGTSTAFFKSGFFGNSSIDIAPSSGSLTLMSPYQQKNMNSYLLKVQSNRSANLSGAVKLQGDLKIGNGKVGAPSEVAVGAGDVLVSGRLLSNGGVSDFFKATAGPTPDYATDNVLADSELQNQSTTRTGDNQVPKEIDANIQQLAHAPVSIDNNAVALPDLADGGNLANGSYATNSLILGSGADAVKVNGPVKIFINDGASARDAVDIQASALVNNTGGPTAPQNLQIWYSGSRAIKLNLDANFKGLIYAPNAPVTLTGSGEFYGALVGDKVTMKNSGTVKIDTSVQGNTGGGGGGANGLSYAANSLGEPLLQGYKAVTWQEVIRSLVP